LGAYLDIVNFASAVFSEQVPVTTIQEARRVMGYDCQFCHVYHLHSYLTTSGVWRQGSAQAAR
jgi:hypothetical protein